MGKFVDLTGQKFGSLEVLRFIGYRKRSDGRNNGWWECLCVCGEHTEVPTGDLRSGAVKSCGCSRGLALQKHGKSNDRIHGIWRGIKGRCLNGNDNAYNHYGGRGIKICDEWLGENGFINFYEWAISNGYRDDLTIERIDVNGDYCPENCKWIPQCDQPKNRRNTLWIEYNGDIRTALEWSSLTGIKYTTIARRIRDGWDIEDVIGISASKYNTHIKRKRADGIDNRRR